MVDVMVCTNHDCIIDRHLIQMDNVRFTLFKNKEIIPLHINKPSLLPSVSTRGDGTKLLIP